MQTSTIYAPPYIDEKTAVIAVAGTTPERSISYLDGYFLGEFMLWYHLVTAATANVIFLTAVNLEQTLHDHGSFQFGNPGFSDSRKVLTLSIYRGIRSGRNWLFDAETSALDSDDLAERFLAAIRGASRYKQPLVNKILILIFAHGTESRPMQFVLGNEIISLQDIQDCLRDVSIDVEVVTTSFSSGGWTSFEITTPKNRQEYLAQVLNRSDFDSRWLASNIDLVDAADQERRIEMQRYLLDLLLKEDFPTFHRGAIGYSSDLLHTEDEAFREDQCGNQALHEEAPAARGRSVDKRKVRVDTGVLLREIEQTIYANNTKAGRCLLDLSKCRGQVAQVDLGTYILKLRTVYHALPPAVFVTDAAWLDPKQHEASKGGFSHIWVRLSRGGKAVPLGLANEELRVLKAMAWGRSDKIVKHSTKWTPPRDAESLLWEGTVFRTHPFATHREHMQFTMQVFELRGRLAHVLRENRINSCSNFNDEKARRPCLDTSSKEVHACLQKCKVFATPLKAECSRSGHFFVGYGRKTYNQSVPTVFMNFLARALTDIGIRYNPVHEGLYTLGGRRLEFHATADLLNKTAEQQFLQDHDILKLARRSNLWTTLKTLRLPRLNATLLLKSGDHPSIDDGQSTMPRVDLLSLQSDSETADDQEAADFDDFGATSATSPAWSTVDEPFTPAESVDTSESRVLVD